MRRFLLAFPTAESDEDLPSLFSAMKPHWERADIEVTFVGLRAASADQVLVDRLSAAVERVGDSDLLALGGFSLGARIAALAAPTIKAAALIGFGYPFHRSGDVNDTHGLEALRSVAIPTLIVQGSRDVHGNQRQVEGYAPLPPHVTLHWLADGNHRLRPRVRSGLTESQHLESAAKAALAFITQIREPCRHD